MNLLRSSADRAGPVHYRRDVKSRERAEPIPNGFLAREIAIDVRDRDLTVEGRQPPDKMVTIRGRYDDLDPLGDGQKGYLPREVKRF